ncbi:MAG: nuclear transport factor 2 family protein [Proteobacteria bacterium]|nr:nuclear transport factor 2 family protein [Pseudomonadota bacterium]
MSHRALLEGLLGAFTKRDLEAVMDCFGADAVVFDPHYPIAEMKGAVAIRRGFKWALDNMEKPGFAVRHFWGDGASGA